MGLCLVEEIPSTGFGKDDAPSAPHGTHPTPEGEHVHALMKQGWGEHEVRPYSGVGDGEVGILTMNVAPSPAMLSTVNVPP